jgi:hypothetical protein
MLEISDGRTWSCKWDKILRSCWLRRKKNIQYVRTKLAVSGRLRNKQRAFTRLEICGWSEFKGLYGVKFSRSVQHKPVCGTNLKS